MRIKIVDLFFPIIATFILDSGAYARSKNDVDTIIVTASGRETNRSENPSAIAVIDGATIQAINAIRIGDVLASAPGTFLSGLNGPREIPQIRQPLAFDNRTLFLEDGVPLQSSIFFDQSALAYSVILASPGSIEVLRGPGTALHGSDAFAGVIHVRSKEASDTPEAALRARYGQFGLYDIVAEAGGPISDNQKLKITAAFSGEEGFRDETAFNRLQFIGKHDFDNGDLSTKSSFVFTRYETEAATAISFADFLEGSRESGLSPLVDPEQAEEIGTYARAQTQISSQLGDQLSFDITPYYRRQDIASTATFQPATVPRTDAFVETFGVLPRLFWKHTSNATTTIGLDVELTDFSRFTFQEAPDTVVFGSLFLQGVQFNYDVSFRGTSPYIQHVRNIGSLTINLGLRYDNLRYDFDNALEEIAGDALFQVQDRVDQFDAFSPKAGIVYDITNQHSIFARYARGFRIPRESDLYELEEGQSEFTLEPETLDSGEVGWRYTQETGTGQIFFELVGYWSVSRDGILTDIQTAAGNISVNAGSSQFRGIELSAQADFDYGISVNGNFSFQDFRFLERSADGNDPFDGNLIAEAPRTLGQIEFSWVPPQISSINMSARLRHIGRWALNDSNTIFTDNEFIFSLFGNWQITERLAMDLRLENITNTLYPVFADAPSFAPNGRARPGAPRTVSGGIKITF